MKRKKLFNIAVDCDDVLLYCVELAINKMQEKYHFEPTLTFEEVTAWAPSGHRTDCILECFDDPKFFEEQTPLPGAQEFIKQLQKKGNIYILTAVTPTIMGIRAQTILKFFPEIDPKNIIITSAKNVVDIDILIDDGAHNILATKAKYPILMRKPWNQAISGLLSANNYNECLKLVDEIIDRYKETPIDNSKPKILALVGPSGSDKNEIAKKLLETEYFDKPISYTTRKKREDESEQNYYFVSKKHFNELKASGEIFESTMYAECAYGSSKSEIESIINKNKNVVIPIDMCGAMGLKATFDNVLTIFIEKNKKDLLSIIINRDGSVEDKVNRIISIEAENKNSEICDFEIKNDGNLSKVVDEILSII